MTMQRSQGHQILHHQKDLKPVQQSGRTRVLASSTKGLYMGCSQAEQASGQNFLTLSAMLEVMLKFSINVAMVNVLRVTGLQSVVLSERANCHKEYNH